MATTAHQKPVKSSSAATGEKPSLLLFAGITLAGLLKDTLDFIGIGSLPGIGLVVTACFSFFSFMLLLLFDRSGGRGNKRVAQGIVVTMGTLVEGIGFVVNFLPLQTLTAVFLYLISYKSWKNSQRAAAVVMRRQRSGLQTQRSRMARAVALREERMAQNGTADSVAEEEAAPSGVTPSDRSVRAPRLQNFSSETVRPQTIGASAVAAGTGDRTMSLAAVPSRGEGGARPLPARPTVGGSSSAAAQPVRLVGVGFPAPRTVPTTDTLPVVKADHGYAIDIGGGEIFGEYATPEEARRAMPEALRSRDSRRAFVASQSAPKRTSLPVVKADHGYAIDIGGGEIFGEYATQAEAERAMPEAIRSRDERAKYLRSSLAQSTPSMTRPQPAGGVAPVPLTPPSTASRPSRSTSSTQPVTAQVSVAPIPRTVPTAPSPKTTNASRPAPYKRIQDLSSDATARIRAAGSRLSQAFRPRESTPTAVATGATVLASGLKGTPAGITSPGKAKSAPQSLASTVSKEQVFEARLDALLRNPTQHFDDSKVTEELFQKTPEYAELKRHGDQINATMAQINEIESALRGYLSVKSSQQGMYGSGEYMATGNQSVRVDAATRLHELSKKYESTFPYMKRYTEWKNINWTNVARSLEVHRDSIGHYRQEKEKFDRAVSDARFRFNQGLTKEYTDWFKRQKITKRAA